jgi:hypothetical protein
MRAAADFLRSIERGATVTPMRKFLAGKLAAELEDLQGQFEELLGDFGKTRSS